MNTKKFSEAMDELDDMNKPGTETKSEDGSYTSHPIAMHKHKQAAIAPFRNQLCFCFAR